MVVNKRRSTSTMDLPQYYEPQFQGKRPLHRIEESEILKDDASGKAIIWRANNKNKERTIPAWSANVDANPQSAEAEDEQLPVRHTVVFTAKRRKSTLSLAVVTFCLLGFSMYSSSRNSLTTALTEVNDLMIVSQQLDLHVRTVEKHVRLLERELAAVERIEQQEEDLEAEKTIRDQASAFLRIPQNPKGAAEMDSIQRKLHVSAGHAESLKDQVQDISKRDTISKYGAGVKRVEIELIFPGSTEGPNSFVIEMAPLDLMPHSVYTFLEMVSNGILDGCSFILNALHVLKAAPLPFDGTPAAVKASAFSKSGLVSVAFREYSPEYPHKKYTVGFAADGSPSFYINMEDNTKIHVGDPCFAKVVSGFDTIKRLEDSPTRNGIWFEHRIGIKRARVLQ
jgi:cyclophilin family peptidyl-prolyl cis-trans isomerase